MANTTKRDVTECDKLSKEVSNKQKASICSSFESFERYRFPSKKSWTDSDKTKLKRVFTGPWYLWMSPDTNNKMYFKVKLFGKMFVEISRKKFSHCVKYRNFT